MDTTPDPLYERLAAIQHDIWAHWMRYLLGECVEVHDDGSCTINVDRVNAWWRQIDTPYDQLTKREKDSDREQVDRFWPLIQGGAAAMIAEFHAVLGQRFGDGGRSRELRAELHREENRELCDELEAGNRIGIAQELADVVYVAYGTAYSEGIDLDAVLREVHRANMSKVGADGRFVLREDGKVLKGSDYRAPDIAAVLSKGDDRSAHTFPIMDLS